MVLDRNTNKQGTHSLDLHGNRKKREIIAVVLERNKNKQTYTYSFGRNTKANEMIVLVLIGTQAKTNRDTSKNKQKHN